MSKLEYICPRLPFVIRFKLFLLCFATHTAVGVVISMYDKADAINGVIMVSWIWWQLYPFLKVRWVYRRTMFTRKPTLKEMNQVHGHIRKHV